uniref:FCD domain-containing protein n=1 Tax=Nocardia mexicana TaxID=279262 RepID=UPI00319DB275
MQRVRSAVLRDSRAHGDIDRTGDTTAPETFGGSRFGSPSALEVEAATLGADATAVPETTADPAIIAVARSGTTSHDQLAVRRELDHWRRLRDNPPEAGPGLVAADEQFHATLLTAAGNSALADALITVHAKIRPIRSLDMPTPDRIAAMTAEHIAIAEHILTGDLDRALDTLLTHILRSRANVLARARRALELTKLGQALRD